MIAVIGIGYAASSPICSTVGRRPAVTVLIPRADVFVQGMVKNSQ